MWPYPGFLGLPSVFLRLGSASPFPALGCRNSVGSTLSWLLCLDPVTPTCCLRSMGTTLASLPGQARPLGRRSCPALPRGHTPGGQAHLHTVRGLPQVGVHFLQDRAGWSPAVDLALNLFTAK